MTSENFLKYGRIVAKIYRLSGKELGKDETVGW
jgi:hypothetical protein